MVRAFTTLALSLLLLTGAQAQSVPTAASKKAASQASRATKRATNKAARVARKATKATKPAATTTDGWPPLSDAPVVASAATDETYGAGPSQSPYGRDNVYAAPGMPVNIRFSKKSDPYSVRPPRKPAAATPAGTTLGSGQ